MKINVEIDDIAAVRIVETLTEHTRRRSETVMRIVEVVAPSALQIVAALIAEAAQPQVQTGHAQPNLDDFLPDDEDPWATYADPDGEDIPYPDDWEVPRGVGPMGPQGAPDATPPTLDGRWTSDPEAGSWKLYVEGERAGEVWTEGSLILWRLADSVDKKTGKPIKPVSAVSIEAGKAEVVAAYERENKATIDIKLTEVPKRQPAHPERTSPRVVKAPHWKPVGPGAALYDHHGEHCADLMFSEHDGQVYVWTRTEGRQWSWATVEAAVSWLTYVCGFEVPSPRSRLLAADAKLADKAELSLLDSGPWREHPTGTTDTRLAHRMQGWELLDPFGEVKYRVTVDQNYAEPYRLRIRNPQAAEGTYIFDEVGEDLSALFDKATAIAPVMASALEIIYGWLVNTRRGIAGFKPVSPNTGGVIAADDDVNPLGAAIGTGEQDELLERGQHAFWQAVTKWLINFGKERELTEEEKRSGVIMPSENDLPQPDRPQILMSLMTAHGKAVVTYFHARGGLGGACLDACLNAAGIPADQAVTLAKKLAFNLVQIASVCALDFEQYLEKSLLTTREIDDSPIVGPMAGPEVNKWRPAYFKEPRSEREQRLGEAQP